MPSGYCLMHNEVSVIITGPTHVHHDATRQHGLSFRVLRAISIQLVHLQPPKSTDEENKSQEG